MEDPRRQITESRSHNAKQTLLHVVVPLFWLCEARRYRSWLNATVDATVPLGEAISAY